MVMNILVRVNTFLIHFVKGGLSNVLFSLLVKATKYFFTHITVYYMRTKYEENLLKIRKII